MDAGLVEELDQSLVSQGEYREKHQWKNGWVESMGLTRALQPRAPEDRRPYTCLPAGTGDGAPRR